MFVFSENWASLKNQLKDLVEYPRRTVAPFRSRRDEAVWLAILATSSCVVLLSSIFRTGIVLSVVPDFFLALWNDSCN